MLKQCGTCRHAKAFESSHGKGPAPSGPQDGVSCDSEAHAKYLDEQTGGIYSQQEMESYGVMSLFRFEVLGDEEYPAECVNWASR